MGMLELSKNYPSVAVSSKGHCREERRGGKSWLAMRRDGTVIHANIAAPYASAADLIRSLS